MKKDLITTIGLQELTDTPTVLELADRSRVKPEGVLEDIVITISSWRYPAHFLILQPKSNFGGHPLILGRPWLTTTDLSLPLSTLAKAQYFKDETQDDIINGFLSNSLFVTSIKNLNEEEDIEDINFQQMRTTLNTNNIPIEIEPRNFTNINPNLTTEQNQLLLQLLQKYKKAFAWDYMDMKGIHPNPCTHCIYLKYGCKPVRQPQRRMNIALKEVVKEELQKLLSDNFIYPISNNQWVSPLFIVPKKNGKWKVCVDYKELNKATQKDHFPLAFID
eukprot:PITA_32635